MFQLLTRSVFLTAVLTALPLAAPSSRAASGHATMAATPVQAVTVLVRPFSGSRYNNAACNALKGRLADCPITPRLRQRLRTANENGNLVCRCQNPPRWMRAWLYSRRGSTAQVEVMWDYGATWYPMVFITVLRQGGWLVDDQYCTARPSTTIYHVPAGPCR